MHQVRAIFTAAPFGYLIGPVLSLLLLFGLPVFAWKIELLGQELQGLSREVQLENVRWQQYLNLLSNAPIVQLSKSTNRTTLEVALREVAQSLQARREVQIDAFAVLPTDTLEIEDELGSLIKPIRISIEATLQDAPALLTILERFALVAGWRVMEVRGCAMQRLASEPRLATACTIDIYHWSWTTNADTEIN